MHESKLIKKKEREIYFTILVVLLWCNSILLNYVRGALLRVPLIGMGADIVMPVVIGAFFLLSLNFIMSHLSGTDLLIALGMAVVYFVHWAIYPGNSYYYEGDVLPFLMGRLSLYFVGVAFCSDRQEERLSILYQASIVTIGVFALYNLVLHPPNDYAMSTGDMNSAYNLLPHACLVFYRMLQKPNGWNISAFGLSCLMLFTLGSRGPVLCIAIFVIASLLMGKNVKKPVIFVIIVLCVLFMIFFEELLSIMLDWGYRIAETFGLSTRVFDKYLSGDFLVSNGRTQIQNAVLHYLNENPIFGLGIYGDRRVAGGHYAHNIFIEICAHFGYVLGGILIILLLVYAIRSYRFASRRGDSVSVLVLMLLLGCNLKLVVSGSYLQEPFFFLLIGYCVAQLRRKKETERIMARHPSILKGRR